MNWSIGYIWPSVFRPASVLFRSTWSNGFTHKHNAAPTRAALLLSQPASPQPGRLSLSPIQLQMLLRHKRRAAILHVQRLARDEREVPAGTEHHLPVAALAEHLDLHLLFRESEDKPFRFGPALVFGEIMSERGRGLWAAKST